jgi:hypothetical protein
MLCDVKNDENLLSDEGEESHDYKVERKNKKQLQFQFHLNKSRTKYFSLYFYAYHFAVDFTVDLYRTSNATEKKIS